MSRRVVHLTTTDMSLDWLLRPQLEAFAAAGYEVIGMSAPGPHVDALRAAGIAHVPIPGLTRSMAPGRDLRALFEALFERDHMQDAARGCRQGEYYAQCWKNNYRQLLKESQRKKYRSYAMVPPPCLKNSFTANAAVAGA